MSTAEVERKAHPEPKKPNQSPVRMHTEPNPFLDGNRNGGRRETTSPNANARKRDGDGDEKVEAGQVSVESNGEESQRGGRKQSENREKTERRSNETETEDSGERVDRKEKAREDK